MKKENLGLTNKKNVKDSVITYKIVARVADLVQACFAFPLEHHINVSLDGEAALCSSIGITDVCLRAIGQGVR